MKLLHKNNLTDRRVAAVHGTVQKVLTALTVMTRCAFQLAIGSCYEQWESAQSESLHRTHQHKAVDMEKLPLLYSAAACRGLRQCSPASAQLERSATWITIDHLGWGNIFMVAHTSTACSWMGRETPQGGRFWRRLSDLLCFEKRSFTYFFNRLLFSKRCSIFIYYIVF